MFGALIGDVAGSTFEFDNALEDDERLNNLLEAGFSIPAGSNFTDDSICTAALAESLLSDASPSAKLREWGRRFPMRGYGERFGRWLVSNDQRPVGGVGFESSYGNGAVMRVSPVALLVANESEIDAVAEAVTVVSHAHPDALLAARVWSRSLWCALMGGGKDEVARLCGEAGYALRPVAYYADHREFRIHAGQTVECALSACLEAESFDEVMINVISMGGDVDTNGATAGPLAEILYGLPERHLHWVLEHLMISPLARSQNIDVYKAIARAYLARTPGAEAYRRLGAAQEQVVRIAGQAQSLTAEDRFAGLRVSEEDMWAERHAEAVMRARVQADSMRGLRRIGALVRGWFGGR